MNKKVSENRMMEMFAGEASRRRERDISNSCDECLVTIQCEACGERTGLSGLE